MKTLNTTLRLIRVRRSMLVSATVFAGLARLAVQQPCRPKAGFEVASVKPAKAGD